MWPKNTVLVEKQPNNQHGHMAEIKTQGAKGNVQELGKTNGKAKRWEMGGKRNEKIRSGGCQPDAKRFR